MIFRQLFDRDSCTYTYLLGCERTREAILIDPVKDLVDRDVQVLTELDLTLKYTLETHVHADHITASGLLRQRLGSQSVLSARGGAPCVDIAIEDGQTLQFGDCSIEARATPGHTNGCTSYYVADEDMIFTGDALFVRGCGRTDFQQGDPATLYASIHGKVFSLPDDTKIYPGHDYKGRTVTTVAEEKAFNPRLGGGRTVEQFAEIMEGLNLAPPKKLAVAVPANLQCGLERPASSGSSTAWAPVVRSGEGVPEVTTAWLGANAHTVRIIDVRQPAEFNDELGHIAGAELVPLADLANAAADWPKDAPIVTVCKSGGRSGNGAALLESMHFQRVGSMAGGMLKWNADGLPTEGAGGETAPAACG
jgi:sulfur dioxygenase